MARLRVIVPAVAIAAAGVGTYNLTLSDGYSVNGTLLSGSIQLQ